MGDHEGILPNGLLPNAVPLLESFDSVRWLKVEERTAELISCIQPNKPSEERRNAVADYVQRLIMKCFPCQVFTFGSVPLKTYLPDGDIDLTAFSNNPMLKDSWASDVRDMLETEEKNENAEFCVKEVQYIQAEVKIIKCLVENIVVDISFNQLGGLCTLCFLEEVDNLINQNHLFKRSIILIKAWCYYESRILGAHHGLISTYALETLVLYIFHVFNNSFAGPLEVVLYRFLEFFSNFDWEYYCVSLWGPVPISSLPDVTAEPPRKDSRELLLNKGFLDACSSVYAVFPGGLDNQGQTFVSKHFNVIDPLRVSNNLGRSVSKGNFFRIRSAFAFGAKKLARLLDCPQEHIVFEVNQFFTNTWDRHGSGIRPDALGTDTSQFNLSIPDMQPIVDVPSGKKFKEFIRRENELEDTHYHDTSRLHSMSAFRAQNQKGQANLNRQKNLVLGQLVDDVQRLPFVRTRSSPELTDSYKDGSHIKPNRTMAEQEKNQPSYRRKNVEIELPNGPNHAQTYHGFDVAVDSNNGSQNVRQEEQDLVNMMASSGLYGFNGQVHTPMGSLQFPFPPSFLAGMGYMQKNFPAMIPASFPFVDPTLSGMRYPHGLVPQLNPFFSGHGVTSDEDSIEPGYENFEQDSSFEPERMSVNSEAVTLDDNVRVSSPGLNYVPPPLRVGGSGGLVRSQSQQKYKKEKRGPLRDDSDVVSDERTTSSRYSSAARSNSLKSKTSSESSWDEASTVNKSTREKQGKKQVVVSAESSRKFFKGKTMFETTSVQPSEDDDQDLVRPPSMGSDTGPCSMHVLMPNVPVHDPAQTSRSDSMVPMGPMVSGQSPRQTMMDTSGAMPIKFYPTGPPVPFFTMLSFYNVPSQPGPSDLSSDLGHVERLDGDQPQDLRPDSLSGAAPGGTQDEGKADILNGDFASHWQNLQFGRYCQSPHQNGPAIYPSPYTVPPFYLQGRVPWDGPGRNAPNMNFVTQLINYGPRFVPVTGPVSGRPTNVYPRYMDNLPRHRSGTGTYLPNLKAVVRDRNSSGPRRGNGNYNHDRSDNHIDKEGNWNANSKPRGSVSGRNQTDKSSSWFGGNESRADRSTGSYRHDHFSTYETQNGSSHPSSSQTSAANMYSNTGGPSSNGSTVPSMVMVYPYEHSTSFASHTEPLQFGSLGTAGCFSGVNRPALSNNEGRDRGTFEQHRLYGGSVRQRSSPDRASSPCQQR
ncbi:hypothetical protein E3N88_04273 [Mikania micrantha]|uniref:Polymerase nucleotidyl transferase domain-containing protein n=1 Tax=Mikania micrantha TaxID=192012 RepID=A0A5N6PU04_9ASTR|nr:hypothetical protein E3N88_04273 [Mikania micrantha]